MELFFVFLLSLGHAEFERHNDKDGNYIKAYMLFRFQFVDKSVSRGRQTR
jgi:hypothetical protein